MDQNSINMMKAVVDELGLDNAAYKVVDMGSYDVNGTYRHLFGGALYLGVDIMEGPNVDIIVHSPEWNCLEDIDVVISGQTIEHVADIPAFMHDIHRILKPGGILCLIAPSEGPAHDYPIWVGNFPPERMKETVESAGFEIISIVVSDELPWKLCRCVAKKASPTPKPPVKQRKEIVNED